MARYDDLNTSAIGYATFISTILFIIVVLLIRALSFYWVEGEADRKLADVHYVAADSEISEQRSRVSGYGKELVTVFKGEGESATEEQVEQIHIPLDAAKDILLDELASDEADHADAGHTDENPGESVADSPAGSEDTTRSDDKDA